MQQRRRGPGIRDKCGHLAVYFDVHFLSDLQWDASKLGPPNPPPHTHTHWCCWSCTAIYPDRHPLEFLSLPLKRKQRNQQQKIFCLEAISEWENLVLINLSPLFQTPHFSNNTILKKKQEINSGSKFILKSQMQEPFDYLTCENLNLFEQWYL